MIKNFSISILFFFFSFICYYYCLPAAVDFAENRKRRNCGKDYHSHRNHHSSFQYKNVKLVPNKGFYAFNFEGKGLPVETAFSFHYDRITTLLVFDCFCSGDGFFVFDNGELASITNTNGFKECEYFSSDPLECSSHLFLDPPNQWSISLSQLKPGVHNITILPYYTPYGAGTGFLRVDDACWLTSSIFAPCCRSDNSCELNTVN